MPIIPIRCFAQVAKASASFAGWIFVTQNMRIHGQLARSGERGMPVRSSTLSLFFADYAR
jgi:hypothetical protein